MQTYIEKIFVFYIKGIVYSVCVQHIFLSIDKRTNHVAYLTPQIKWGKKELVGLRSGKDHKIFNDLRTRRRGLRSKSH